MSVAAEGAKGDQESTRRSGPAVWLRSLALFCLHKLWRALASIPQRADLAVRPWKERALLETYEQPIRRKLRRAASFTLLLLCVSMAMMAALILPESGAPTPAAAAPPTFELRLAEPVATQPTNTAPLQLSTIETQEWQPVRKPVHVFHLEGSEVEGSDLDYRVNTRGAGARQDVMIWTPKPDRIGVRARIVLMIERFEGVQPTQRPLYADMAQRVANQYMTLHRMSEPGEIRSKFGALQVAEAHLSQDGMARACTLFRRLDMGGLVIAGWYCAPPQRPGDRVALACFINRLDLVSAGTDHDLRRHFAESERQRGNCVSARQSGRKITWLDHEAPMPALKLSKQGR